MDRTKTFLQKYNYLANLDPAHQYAGWLPSLHVEPSLSLSSEYIGVHELLVSHIWTSFCKLKDVSGACRTADHLIPTYVRPLHAHTHVTHTHVRAYSSRPMHGAPRTYAYAAIIDLAAVRARRPRCRAASCRGFPE